MDTISKQYERKLLDQAMENLIRVQLGNESREVEGTLDFITDDLDSLINEKYGDVSDKVYN